MTEDQLAERREDRIQFGMMLQSINDIQNDIKEIKTDVKKLDSEYVNKSDIKEIKDKFVTTIEFTPVKNIVYGMVAVLCLSILTAIIRLAVIK